MEKMGEGDWGPPKPLKKETVKPRGKEAAPVGPAAGRSRGGQGAEEERRGDPEAEPGGAFSLRPQEVTEGFCTGDGWDGICIL